MLRLTSFTAMMAFLATKHLAAAETTDSVTHITPAVGRNPDNFQLNFALLEKAGCVPTPGGADLNYINAVADVYDVKKCIDLDDGFTRNRTTTYLSSYMNVLYWCKFSDDDPTCENAQLLPDPNKVIDAPQTPCYNFGDLFKTAPRYVYCDFVPEDQRASTQLSTLDKDSLATPAPERGVVENGGQL